MRNCSIQNRLRNISIYNRVYLLRYGIFNDGAGKQPRMLCWSERVCYEEIVIEFGCLSRHLRGRSEENRFVQSV